MPPHQDLRCLQIQLFSSLVLKVIGYYLMMKCIQCHDLNAKTQIDMGIQNSHAHSKTLLLT